MAVNFKDGVILGADSRTTTGAYIANRVTDKLTQVHDTIWCCRSGSAADTQAVADIVQYHLGMYGITNDEPPTTQTAAAIFQELCYDNKDALRYERNTHRDETLDVQMLMFGTAPVSSLQAGTTGTAGRSTPSLSAALFTSRHMPSAVRDRHTSTVTAMRTGEKECRRTRESSS